MEKIKIIETKDIPKPSTLRGKTSIVPEILKQIPEGKTGIVIDGKPYKVATIRSYIEKQHKLGQLTQYIIQQRTTREGEAKIIRLYIIYKGENQ